MQIAVVVVTWNCADSLSTLVDSMNLHLEPASVQLVVVDNASDDDPISRAHAWRGDLETVLLPVNRGFGVASNTGVRVAAHDAVVLLNPDTWLVDGSVLELGRAALSLRALVGPRILNPDGTVQPSASAAPVGPWPWVRALAPVAAMPRPIVARTEPWRLRETVRVSWLTGACIAAPRELLLRLGPFDEAIEMYGEDMDLGLRAAAEGVASYFLPDVARVVHVGDASASRRFADRGLSATAASFGDVLLRRYGSTRAHRGLLAEQLRVRVRIYAKRALRRDAAREAAWLQALTAAQRPC